MKMVEIYEAGRMEGTFFVRAVMAGSPGTTGNLIDLSTHDPIKKIVIENAEGRARAYLSKDEITIWRSGLDSLIGRKPTDEEVGQYALGKINAYATSSAAAELGRKGGSVKSPRKAASSVENGKKGGRPKKVAE